MSTIASSSLSGQQIASGYPSTNTSATVADQTSGAKAQTPASAEAGDGYTASTQTHAALTQTYDANGVLTADAKLTTADDVKKGGVTALSTNGSDSEGDDDGGDDWGDYDPFGDSGEFEDYEITTVTITASEVDSDFADLTLVTPDGIQQGLDAIDEGMGQVVVSASRADVLAAANESAPADTSLTSSFLSGAGAGFESYFSGLDKIPDVIDDLRGANGVAAENNTKAAIKAVGNALQYIASHPEVVKQTIETIYPNLSDSQRAEIAGRVIGRLATSASVTAIVGAPVGAGITAMAIAGSLISAGQDYNSLPAVIKAIILG